MKTCKVRNKKSLYLCNQSSINQIVMKKLFLVVVFLAIGWQQIFAQTIAHTRAATLGKGINYAEFGNFWSGNPANNYMDYLDLSILPYVKSQINLMSQMGFKTLRLPVCFSSWEDGIAVAECCRAQFRLPTFSDRNILRQSTASLNGLGKKT